MPEIHGSSKLCVEYNAIFILSFVSIVYNFFIFTEVIFKDSFLVLAPFAGQNSGVNSYSFKPRRARYIQLKIQQDDYYLIKTPAGVRYRKAIGLRELYVNSIVY